MSFDAGKAVYKRGDAAADKRADDSSKKKKDIGDEMCAPP